MNPFYQGPLRSATPYQIQIFTKMNYPPHWHTEIELYYVLNGQLDMTVGGQTRRLTARMLTVVGCAEVHSVDRMEEGTRVLVFKLGYYLLGTGYDKLVGCDFRDSVVNFNTLPDTTMERGLNVLAELAEHPVSEGREAAAMDFRIRAYLCGVSAELLELAPKDGLSPHRRKQVEDMLSIQKVLNYIEEHYQSRITLELAVDLSGYEKTRFCQLFRMAMGVPFHKYLNNYRIEMAKWLLNTTDKSVKYIAEAVGLPEAKTFSRVFRECEGMTPTEWKKKNRP